ncbi:MAG: ATP synthase F1 subunit epsilon [Verrucomicrobia bacterium]|nr:ATP synthase F1 subunit epsilon [Verrucomicrobiota bacterium]
MTGGLKLEITTPTGQVYSKEVDMVTLPGQEGEMGILPMHVPLIALLGDGEIIAKRGNEEDRLLVTGGCVEITPNRVAILTVFATDENAIDEKKAEDARARAEARLKEKLSPEEVVLVQASLAHSLAQLKFKRHRAHPHCVWTALRAARR